MEMMAYLATPSMIAEHDGVDGMRARIEAMGMTIASGPVDEDDGCVLFMVQVPA